MIQKAFDNINPLGEVAGFSEIEKLKYNKVDDKIEEQMCQLVLLSIREEKAIDWDLFAKFLYEEGSNNPPNIFTVPHPVIEKCFNKIKEEFGDDYNN